MVAVLLCSSLISSWPQASATALTLWCYEDSGPYVSFCVLSLNTSADEHSPTSLKNIAITEFTAGVDLQSVIVKENIH